MTVGKLSNVVASATTDRGGSGARDVGKLGLRVEALTSELANQYALQVDHGVIITEVQAGSPASLADLQPGDVIQQADRKPVTSVAELENAVAGAGEQMLLLISRKGTNAYVVVGLK